MANRYNPPDPLPRFWANVTKTDGCWLWSGYVRKPGRGMLEYGSFQIKGKTTLVHRFSYELHNGPIPEGLTIDHLCGNPRCVNPEHLEAVPIRTNVLRGKGPSAMAARTILCPSGHPYTPGNTRRDPKGKRHCRTCDRERWHRRKPGVRAAREGT